MVYLIYTVYDRVKRLSYGNIFSEKIIKENIKDVSIIILQIAVFVINVDRALELN